MGWMTAGAWIVGGGLLLMALGSIALLFVAPLWVKWAVLVLWGVCIAAIGVLTFVIGASAVGRGQ